ncbi:MAG: Ig-like domain-containing protein [Eubacteriales bacterium]|nr:Ig-like domain-containing protein [Eubacteriales bacterium]
MKHKRSLSLLLASVLLVLSILAAQPFGLPAVVEAHSGRTDAYGGHHDYKNVSGLGYYHYHCGGNPAHLHPNGVCPYADTEPEPEPETTPAEPEPAAPVVSLSKTSATLTVGKTLKLRLKNASGSIVWKTGRKSIAEVSSSGKVTAKKAGQCTIAATCSGVKYTCKLTVVNPFKLKKSTLTLKPGKSASIGTNVKASSVKWVSSNKKVATISKTGKVTAKKAGTCWISATYMGKTPKCKVTVKKA